MKKNHGFTVIEGLIALAVLALGILIYANTGDNIIDLQRAQLLKDQTQIYAKLFANYINQNESQILPIANSSTPIVIPISQIISSGISPSGLNPSNFLKQAPCASILKNSSSGNLEAIMYYVSSSPNSSFKEPMTNRAILGLAGIGGEYNNGEVKTATWQIASNSPFFTGANQCVAGKVISEKSIVVNLNLLPEFSKSVLPDVSLHRTKDQLNSNLGDPGNKNTSLSDITFTQNNGVVLNNQGNIKLQANGNQAVVQNGDIMASTIQPTLQVPSGTSCQSSELGKVAQQGDTLNIGTKQSDVVCTFSPLVCSNNSYCYLPVTNNTVNYTNSSNNGKLGKTFLCPANTPYLVNATAYQQNNPNPTISTNIVQYNGYSIPRGATAVGNNNMYCKVWQYGFNSCWRDQTLTCNAGTNYYIKAECNHGAVTRACDGTNYNDWAGYSPTCLQWTPPPPAFINSATCSSKLVVQVN